MRTIKEKVEESKRTIEYALSHYDRIALYCSFGKDSMAVLRLALDIDLKVRVIFVTTKFKPKETMEYSEMIAGIWNLRLDVYKSPIDVDPELPKYDPDECCRILKVEPTKLALKDLDAWITGLRRTEGRTRVDYGEVEQSLKDDGEVITKINPILDWTETDVWKYLAIMSVPIHPWYEMGYRSLGCMPCTHLVDDNETERAGRWMGTSKCGGECGIHTMYKRS